MKGINLISTKVKISCIKDRKQKGGGGGGEGGLPQSHKVILHFNTQTLFYDSQKYQFTAFTAITITEWFFYNLREYTINVSSLCQVAHKASTLCCQPVLLATAIYTSSLELGHRPQKWLTVLIQVLLDFFANIIVTKIPLKIQ